MTHWQWHTWAAARNSHEAETWRATDGKGEHAVEAAQAELKQ